MCKMCVEWDKKKWLWFSTLAPGGVQIPDPSVGFQHFFSIMNASQIYFGLFKTLQIALNQITLLHLHSLCIIQHA